jgi:hypothetical protein
VYPIYCFVCVVAQEEGGDKAKTGSTVFKGTLLCKEHAKEVASDRTGAIFITRQS